MKQSAPSQKSVARAVREKVLARLRRHEDEVMQVIDDCLADPLTGRAYDEEKEIASDGDDDIPF